MLTDHSASERPGPSDLEVALAAMTAAQGYVQQADGKVNVLLVLYTAGTATVATALGGPGAARPPALWVLLGLFVLTFLVSGYHVLQAFRPRLAAAVPVSRFGMVEPPTAVSADPRAQAEEAWALSRLLSRIALAKNRHLARATPWTAALLICGVAAALLRG